MEKYLAIDVGGSALKYAVIDEQLNFTDHGSVPADVSTREKTFETIKAIYEDHGKDCAGIGMSIPGSVDRSKGFAYSGGAFLWVDHEPYAEEVSKMLNGVPVTIVNDAKSAAMAEMGYGNLQNVANGIVLVLGTGIGGAIILNGNLIQGSHFTAGEFSFLRGDVEEREGKFDSFAGYNGIPGLKDAIRKSSGLEDIDGLKAFKLIKEEHNEQVLQGVKDYCYHLAFYIYNLQAALDVERVLIGGGISNEPMFLELVQEAVNKKFASAFMLLIQKPEIMTCRYHNDANLIGAIYNFRDVTGRNA